MNSGKIVSLILVTLLCNCTRTAERTFESLSENERRMPEYALSSMRVSEGLDVSLFASEPMVVNPTNMSIDHLGRVWICEAANYDVSPDEEDKNGDRIIVLEDSDGDGRADKRTIFYQGTDINTPLGIFVTGNKVYISRSPDILVFYDDDGDLIADRKETLFTGLGRKGDHSAHSILPGPDGMLYFSMGNMAGEMHDPDGTPIFDKAGFRINQKGEPYLGGMVIRFDAGGKNVEVLGHNFRNNYEPCLDSFGNIWQSDNDDDGNASCRINFVVPYGNYGYVDEKTRASWTSYRLSMETTISERHWHQSDPGVIPNVLITGAGSPAGMVFNEGDALTQAFADMPIHAEPYYNVVRGYRPERKGAGYTATVHDILVSEDQWFRPVDVSIAPDGSLFIADWYDPILGGGAAADARQGRIYRVAKKANRYTLPDVDFQSVEGLVHALMSPNPETRFTAFHLLSRHRNDAIERLRGIWNSGNALHQVRAFWALRHLDPDGEWIDAASRHPDPRVRGAAVKSLVLLEQNPVVQLQKFSTDPDAHVRRESVTALRYAHNEEGAELWSSFASAYDGSDRWFLEALGVGSDLHADQYFEKWLSTVTLDLSSKRHRDLVWRVRARKALPLLADIIRISHPDSMERYFRAFDFHKGQYRNDVLLTLLDLDRPDKDEIAALALQQMDETIIRMTPRLRSSVELALLRRKGTLAYLNLVRKFGLRDKTDDLIEIAIDQSDGEVGGAAIDLLIRMDGSTSLRNALAREEGDVIALIRSMRGRGNRDIVGILGDIVMQNTNFTIQQEAVQALGTSWPGEEKLLQLAADLRFPNELKPAASGILFNVYRSSIQREAEKHLPRPSYREGKLPPVKELVASDGNRTKGADVFRQYCLSCHRAENEGARFGPELTTIGSKLSKEGLYRAIIFPDEGISHGYGAVLLTLRDDTSVMGIITSETDEEVELSQPGGHISRFARSQVVRIQPYQRSAMPDLTSAMNRQDLVNLVSYLESLKN